MSTEAEWNTGRGQGWEIQHLDRTRPQSHAPHVRGHWGWAALVAAVTLTVWVAVAHAHSSDRPELNDWLMAQRNVLGSACCDGDDVMQLSDSEWRIAGDHYEVNFRGKWEPVPNSTLTQEPGNLMPNALVWIWQNRVQCFKPATFY
jgi:hypothetical protein